MSFTKSKYDNCFMNQQDSNNKSIFQYVVDTTKFVNQNECNNYTPPFLTYIPTGVSSRSVDIENDLKGITRPYSKCDSCQFNAPIMDAKKLNENNKPECEHRHNILPDGYVKRQ